MLTSNSAHYPDVVCLFGTCCISSLGLVRAAPMSLKYLIGRISRLEEYGETMRRTSGETDWGPVSVRSSPAQLHHLPLQLLLKLFNSTHCFLLFESDLLFYLRAYFFQQTHNSSEDVLAVLHCFISRTVNGLQFLLKNLQVFPFFAGSFAWAPPISLFLNSCCRSCD